MNSPIKNLASFIAVMTAVLLATGCAVTAAPSQEFTEIPEKCKVNGCIVQFDSGATKHGSQVQTGSGTILPDANGNMHSNIAVAHGKSRADRVIDNTFGLSGVAVQTYGHVQAYQGLGRDAARVHRSTATNVAKINQDTAFGVEERRGDNMLEAQGRLLDHQAEHGVPGGDTYYFQGGTAVSGSSAENTTNVTSLADLVRYLQAVEQQEQGND